MEKKNVELERAQMLAEQSYTPIYSTGLRAELERLLSKRDIDSAKKLFACHREEALNAIAEFDTQKHKIKSRENKTRVDKEDYETCKLPRGLQKVTNNTGTFFMFGNNLNFSLGNKPEEAKELLPYFEIFKKYLKDKYFNERMYQARQITGSETECAKVYTHYTDEDGEAHVVCQIKCNSQGDTLYSLFNQYGKMIAFAIGYKMRNMQLREEEHFDVYTDKYIWPFVKHNDDSNATDAWTDLGRKENNFKKIPVIYYHHEVDWLGAQERIERLEWVDSKRGDTNEYFGDPYLVVTKDVVDNRLADANQVGKVIMTENKDSEFKFVAPPDCGDMIENEKTDLKTSIEQDTLTPDWSYKSIMGLGTLSGEAMRRANLPGYVKRTNFSVKVYNELIRREINLIIAILCNYEYLHDSEVVDGLKRLEINFSYTDPFVGGIEDNSTEIATLMGAGAMSVHAAVMANRHIEDKAAEEERIWQEYERREMIKAKAALLAKKEAETDSDNNNEESEEE